MGQNEKKLKIEPRFRNECSFRKRVLTFANPHLNDTQTFLFVLGLLCASLFLSGCKEQDNKAQAQVQRPAPEVGVFVVEQTQLPMTMELSGRISARLVAEVRPQVSGIIKERLFTEGSEVEKGQELYQIDPSSYKAAFNSAQAALAKARANLIPLQNKEQRYRGLVKTKAVSQQDYDDIKASMIQAEADVAAAEAALETARINLDYTSVVAPITGRIGRSSVTTGALVLAGQQSALATIQQLDTVNVDVTQASVEMLRLKRAIADGELKLGAEGGAPVRLVLEDNSDYRHDGTLKFSEVTVDQGTGSVTLRTVFPNPEELLLPGMFVRAILETGVRENAILVPQQGVTHDQTGKAVSMVVGKDDKVEARQLFIDRAIGNKWLVNEGLQPGDRVIVEGVQKVRPGTVVHAVNVAAKSIDAASQSLAVVR